MDANDLKYGRQRSILDQKREEDQPEEWAQAPAENSTVTDFYKMLGMNVPRTNAQSQEFEESTKDLPMRMGLAGMGTIGDAGKAAGQFGKVIMAGEQGAPKLGNVIMKPSMQDQMAGATSGDPAFFSKLQQLLKARQGQ